MSRFVQTKLPLAARSRRRPRCCPPHRCSQNSLDATDTCLPQPSWGGGLIGLGIPEFEAPGEGGRLPADRTVRFAQRGNDPDMFSLSLSADVLYWQTWAPGAARAFRFPDLSGVMGLRDLPAGAAYYMYLTGFRLAGFAFNEFRYTTLSQLYWSAYAARNLTFTR